MIGNGPWSLPWCQNTPSDEVPVSFSALFLCVFCVGNVAGATLVNYFDHVSIKQLENVYICICILLPIFLSFIYFYLLSPVHPQYFCFRKNKFYAINCSEKHPLSAASELMKEEGIIEEEGL